MAAHIEATIEQSVIISCARSSGPSASIVILSAGWISESRFQESRMFVCVFESSRKPVGSLEDQSWFRIEMRRGTDENGSSVVKSAQGVSVSHGGKVYELTLDDFRISVFSRVVRLRFDSGGLSAGEALEELVVPSMVVGSIVSNKSAFDIQT